MTPNNPAEILLSLDQQLDHEVSLVLYGRAALALGFDETPLAFQATQDVDAIISLSQLPELTADTGFWDAVEVNQAAEAQRARPSIPLFSASSCSNKDFFYRSTQRLTIGGISKLTMD